MTSRTKLEISGNQIDGARDYQEDAFMVARLGEGEQSNAEALVIMADGMGGHAAGNVASNMVTSTFNKVFSARYPTDDVPDALEEALLKSNDTIRSAVRETPGLKGMGCTMVAALVRGDRLWWISVGDSHLYLLRDRELIKLNADHSYGGYLQRMREQGMAVDPDPNLSPNMLMSAMIGEEIAEIDLSREPTLLRPGDRVLVASDGLDTLGQGAVIQYAAWSDTPRECVQRLLEAVESAHQPRQDNTTVVCVDVLEDQQATPPAPAAGGPLAAEGERYGDTQDLTIDESALPPGMEIPVLEPEPEPAGAGHPAWGDGAVPEEPGSRRGWILGGLAVVLVLGLGIGAALLLWSPREPEVMPEVAVAPIAPPEPAPAPPPPPPVEAEPVPEASPGFEALLGDEPLPELPPIGEEPPLPEPAAPAAPPPPAPAPEPAPDPVPEPVPDPVPEAPVAEVGPQPGEVFQDPLQGGGQAPPMVVVPSGSFMMGSRGSALQRDELPRHQVSVPAFAVGRYEVTFAEYDRFARATGRPLPPDEGLDRDRYPVVNVSWDDAYAYVRWLSDRTGERYRLPSEAEWEYAARGGTETLYWWGQQVGREHAHCFDCGSGLHPRLPARVGFFEANPFGLYDTAGNVAEWVHDCWHPSYKGAPDDGSVWEGGDCTQRVIRGGSYSSASSAIRSASRDKRAGNQRFDDVGFRIARDLRAAQ